VGIDASESGVPMLLSDVSEELEDEENVPADEALLFLLLVLTTSMWKES
jgi:hypothetical protein